MAKITKKSERRKGPTLPVCQNAKVGQVEEKDQTSQESQNG